MSVNEMLMISKMLLGAMLLFIVLAVVIFFKMDIRKAWNIVTGAKPTGYMSKYAKTAQRPGTKELMAKQNAQNTEDNATVMLQPEMFPQNLSEEFGPTMVLDRADMAETTLLVREGNTGNKFEIIFDITYIHTQITI